MRMTRRAAMPRAYIELPINTLVSVSKCARPAEISGRALGSRSTSSMRRSGHAAGRLLLLLGGGRRQLPKVSEGVLVA